MAVVIVGIGLFFDAYEHFLAATIAEVLQGDFGLGGTGLKLIVLLPVLDSAGAGAGAVSTVVAVAMGRLVLDVGLLGSRTSGRSVDA